MSLKAVLFDFNGVIINDEPIHKQLIDEILLEENLRPKPGEFFQFCLGRGDRACLKDLLTHRGRFVNPQYLDELVARKAKRYLDRLNELPKLPIYAGAEELIFRLRVADIKIGLVSGALRSEVELVLDRANLAQYFPIIVAGDDITVSKPEPDGYLLAVERLKQQYPELNVRASDCLAIEDTFAGIEAAKRAGMQVVGLATTYPFHMLQRLANWTVDYLSEVELDRIRAVFGRVPYAIPTDI